MAKWFTNEKIKPFWNTTLSTDTSNLLSKITELAEEIKSIGSLDLEKSISTVYVNPKQYAELLKFGNQDEKTKQFDFVNNFYHKQVQIIVKDDCQDVPLMFSPAVEGAWIEVPESPKELNLNKKFKNLDI